MKKGILVAIIVASLPSQASQLLGTGNSVQVGVASLIGAGAIGAAILQLASSLNCDNSYTGKSKKYCQQNGTSYQCGNVVSKNRPTTMCLKPLKGGDWTYQQMLQTGFGAAVATSGLYASMFPNLLGFGSVTSTEDVLRQALTLVQLQGAYAYYSLLSSDSLSTIFNGASIVAQTIALIVMARRPRAEINDPFGLARH